MKVLIKIVYFRFFSLLITERVISILLCKIFVGSEYVITYQKSTNEPAGDPDDVGTGLRRARWCGDAPSFADRQRLDRPVVRQRRLEPRPSGFYRTLSTNEQQQLNKDYSHDRSSTNTNSAVMRTTSPLRSVLFSVNSRTDDCAVITCV